MPKIETTSYEDLHADMLKDPVAKREYERLRPWFNRELKKMQARIAAEQLAHELVTLRKEKKLSQKKLAEKAGITQDTLAQLEAGTSTRFSYALVRKIASALGAVPEIHLKVQ